MYRSFHNVIQRLLELKKSCVLKLFKRWLETGSVLRFHPRKMSVVQKLIPVDQLHA
jgi:hypothetical protein